MILGDSWRLSDWWRMQRGVWRGLVEGLHAPVGLLFEPTVVPAAQLTDVASRNTWRRRLWVFSRLAGSFRSEEPTIGRKASIGGMRTGIYLFLVWGVPVMTVGVLCFVAYARRSSSGRSLPRR